MRTGCGAGLRDVVYASTSTMGVRQAPTTKFMLPRTWVDVQVDGHVVPVKVGHDASA